MPNYEVHYLNVSDADAIIIRYEDSLNKYIVLIDAGNIGDANKNQKLYLESLENLYYWFSNMYSSRFWP